MTKTPQQIKNEVEKEIEEFRRGKGHFLMKGVKEVMIRGISYEDIEEIEQEIDILEAKLSILTEYDKSIKEMILGFMKEHTYKINKLQDMEIIRILPFEIEDLLSKIRDNSEVKRIDGDAQSIAEYGVNFILDKEELKRK